MPLTLTPFDPADYLHTPEEVAAYLDSAFGSGDPAIVADALGVVARSRGMTQLSREAGVPRATLYKALSPSGRPEFATVMKVLHALGLRLSASPAAAQPDAA